MQKQAFASKYSRSPMQIGTLNQEQSEKEEQRGRGQKRIRYKSLANYYYLQI